MKRKIINSVISCLETIAVIGFLLFPVLAFLGGLFSGGIVSALIAGLIGGLMGIVIFGGLFLLMQNNQTLKDIRALLQAKSGV